MWGATVPRGAIVHSGGERCPSTDCSPVGGHLRTDLLRFHAGKLSRDARCASIARHMKPIADIICTPCAVRVMLHGERVPAGLAPLIARTVAVSMSSWATTRPVPRPARGGPGRPRPCRSR